MSKLRHGIAKLLVFAMLFAALPVTAFAEQEPGIFSGSDFKPGTYTVSANLKVEGKYVLPVARKAFDIYPCNPKNPFLKVDDNTDITVEGGPPTVPYEDNATLKITEDGKMELSVRVRNPVFTVQKIDGKPENIYSFEAPNTDGPDTPYGRFEGRVRKLDADLGPVEVNRWGIGTYTFSDCMAYAIPLDYPENQNGEIRGPFRLEVDFSKIPHQANLPEIKDLTYTGKEQAGFEQSTHITYGGTLKAKDAGTYEATLTPKDDFKWADGTRDTKTVSWSIRKAPLTVKLKDENIKSDQKPELKIEYKGFVNGETESTAENFVPATVKAPEKPESGEIYTLTPEGGSAKNYEFRYESGVLAVDRKVTVVPEAVKDLVYDGTEQTGVPAGEGYTIENGTAVHPGEYVAKLTLKKGYVWSDRSETVKTVSYRIAPAVLSAKYVSENVEYKQEPKWKVEVTGFVHGETAATAEGYQAPTVKKPDDFRWDAEFTLTPEGGVAKDYTFKYQSGTLMTGAVRVEKPKFVKSKTYNGMTQVSVTKSEFYTLEGSAEGKNVGLYEVKAVLKEGCVWDDGTTDPVRIRWNITPATLTASYISETVMLPEKPAYQVGVTGFVGEDTAKNAAEFTAPTVEAVTMANETKSYSLMPAGGSALNYVFRYVAGTLHMQKNPYIETYKATKEVLKPAVYTATANIWFEKEKTGLPMNPHITNPGFPPNVPVKDNAKLTVDRNGHLLVSVPVTIREAIMGVKEIKGLDIIASERNKDGYLTEVTFDLGAYRNAPATLEKDVEVSVHLGDLPSSMVGKSDITWPAKFRLGLPQLKTEVKQGETIIWKPVELTDDVTTLTVSDQEILGNLNDRDLKLVSQRLSMSELAKKYESVAEIVDTMSAVGYDLKVVNADGDIVPGMKGRVTIAVGMNFANQNVFVYSLDRQGKTEEIAKVVSDEKGRVTFDAPHFSIYIPAVKLEDHHGDAPGKTEKPEKKKPHQEKPETGKKPESGEQGKHDAKVDPNPEQKTSEVKKERKVTVQRLQPGRYTVTANIWFNRADTGLPMNPHITNPGFPPKDPVADNATLIVDRNYRARVVIPITIKSDIMNIKTVSGLNIVDAVKDAQGYYRSITVDLGVISDPNAVITKRIQISLDMGDKAMAMSGKAKEQNWPATFQVNLSGVKTTNVTMTIPAGQSMPMTGVSSDLLPFGAMLAMLAMLSLFPGIRRKHHKD